MHKILTTECTWSCTCHWADLACRDWYVALFIFLISVHRFELRTGLNRTVENRFFPVLFSPQFGSRKLVKVQFTVWQKVPRTGLNWTSSDVPARLGPKAPALAWPEAALAWPEAALACWNPGPSQSRHSRLGLGLARPRPRLLACGDSEGLGE